MSTTGTAMVMDSDYGSHGTMKIENTEKRDTLRATEERYQTLWREEKLFEADAPSCAEHPLESTSAEELRSKFPKFFGTMAYPYVNGSPHLGHAFTVSKVEFASRVARAQGKNTLYPQGYHATGMPIKACADKLVHEMEMFGKEFEGCTETVLDENIVPITTPTQVKEDVTKFTNVKKGKAALKTTKAKYQFQVMLSLGIPRGEIHKFADAQYWLHFFPQLWKTHLSEFGCSIDWRRSFITTDANPYYDSFVQWQMRRLKELGKIQFGKRHTIYSAKDGQPCLDHDRSVGESVQVQEYTAIKCRVKKWAPKAHDRLSGCLPINSKVFLLPATLRPETMYGQTNIFISPKIVYGIYQVSDEEFYVVTDRAARNMAFQGVFPTWGAYTKIADVNGSDVIGSVVSAPLSWKQDVYVLPMDTIKDTKGTGVVTSVPSDSPDDYAMTLELSKKTAFYNIQPEWVSLDLLPIIDVPGFGNLIAPALVQKMKISSPKDVQQLAEAKEVAYKSGFYQGKMIVGNCAGKPVQEAKELIRQSLLDFNDAIVYCEPDGLAISRSGDECVAAYLDQWFLTYGPSDEAWRSDVLRHVRDEDGQGFSCFPSTTKNALEQTLMWLTQWSVTRQYGLGTKLPWDPSELVEGLSDSTIYMAYYTIAHYLHSDIFGLQPGIGNVTAGQMTDAVWDYVFAIQDDVPSHIDKDTLKSMRREFTYWYPLDVRSSGKDLITNHLVFFLYIHQAIWGGSAPEYLPKGIRVNGHITLNGEKMSKSTGNFLTLDSAMQKFGADATRIALADGGDGVEDANFDESVANSIILKLFELRKWIEEVITSARVLKDDEDYIAVRNAEKIKTADAVQRSGAKVFWDELFENELNMRVKETIQHFEDTNYKVALKSGFYEFTAARDSYRMSTSSASIGMHHDCLRRYVELQALMVFVIAPHWADYIWREVLDKPQTIQRETFPQVPEPNVSLTNVLDYIRSVIAAIGAAEGAQKKRLAKRKNVRYDPNQPKSLTVFVAKTWPKWQEKYVDLVREMLDGVTLDTKKIADKVDKTEMKKAMPFIQGLKRKIESGEPKNVVLERNLGFDELSVLHEIIPVLKATVVKLKEIEVVVVQEEEPGLAQMAGSAEPGSPSFEFSNV